MLAQFHKPVNICTSMRRLELFPFRYRDPVSETWVKARYVAEQMNAAAQLRGQIAASR